MSTEQTIIEILRGFPTDKQEEVIAYAGNLYAGSQENKAPRNSGRGLWADLGIDLSDEDINDARREMWKSFPPIDF